MKKELTFKKFFLIFFSLFILIYIVIIIVTEPRRYIKVFEVNKEEYSLEIIEGEGYNGAWRTEDVFSYETEKKVLKNIDKNIFQGNVEETARKILKQTGGSSVVISDDDTIAEIYQITRIGCGKLLLVGHDADKEYLYGKSEYGNEKRGFGIYQKDSEHKFVTGDGPLTEFSVNGKKYNSETYLREQCTGHFVLNLKTGEYKGGLSEEEQQKYLLNNGIKNEILTVEKFLELNGKSTYNHRYSDWMTLTGN